MKVNVEKNKANIIKTLEKLKNEENNERKKVGIDNLIQYLLSTDFFTAPASTHYHLSCEGGLAQHSLNVYKRLYNEVITEITKIVGDDEEAVSKVTADMRYSIVICSLCHDICKTNFYEATTRNIKNPETGKWETVPSYSVNDQLAMGHGEKSLYILMKLGVVLSDEEALAIRWHMGGFDTAFKGGAYGLNEVYDKSLLALLLHIADQKASHIDEIEK